MRPTPELPASYLVVRTTYELPTSAGRGVGSYGRRELNINYN